MRGVVEFGGTKTICALVDGHQLVKTVTFPTAEPESCFNRIHHFFEGEALEHLGIAAFGPISVDCTKSDYGVVLRTPKPFWSNTCLIGGLMDLSESIDIDTDVNCSCLGEYKFDGFSDDSCLVYITIGTGIGAGVVIRGKPLHGGLHPEVGHILLKRHCNDDFTGSCPFHTDCATALASGRAVEDRLGTRGENLSEGDPVWDLEAYYIAQVVYTSSLSYSPNHIVLGGGVMGVPGILEKVRGALKEIDGGYIFDNGFDFDGYVLKSRLNGMQALLGADVLDTL